MSYKIEFKPFKECKWYKNSVSHLIEQVQDGYVTATGLNQAYERYFNVKLLVGKHRIGVIGIEFPNEEEATLFVLRWS